MEQVKKLLKDYGSCGYLATIDKGKPRVRAFGFLFEEDGRFYFSTNRTKEVYRQLTEYPYVEYAVTANDMTMLRISAEIHFTEDTAKKRKAIEISPIVKQIYGSADNPVFKVFFIEHGTAVISDFSGRPPRKLEF